jgi:hypothetical protein
MAERDRQQLLDHLSGSDIKNLWLVAAGFYTASSAERAATTTANDFIHVSPKQEHTPSFHLPSHAFSLTAIVVCGCIKAGWVLSGFAHAVCCPRCSLLPDTPYLPFAAHIGHTFVRTEEQQPCGGQGAKDWHVQQSRQLFAAACRVAAE